MFFICTACPFGVKVTDDSPLLDGISVTCPDCGSDCASGTFADGSVISAKRVRSLTSYELYLLTEGMGFPEERDCVAELVVEELSKPIKRIVASTVPGTTRTVIDTIQLEDGTTLFFSGSAHGAIVYRIRKPNPYTSNKV